MASPPTEQPGGHKPDNGKKPLSKDYPGLANRAAALFAAKGVQLDFSIESVVALDRWMDSAWGKDGAAPKAAKWAPDKDQTLIINQLGCYLGELLARAIGGGWKEDCNAYPFPYCAGVVPKTGGAPALPFKAVYMRMRDGSSCAIKNWIVWAVASMERPASPPEQTAVRYVRANKSVEGSMAGPGAPRPQEEGREPLQPETPQADPLAAAEELKFKGAEMARQGRFEDALKHFRQAVGLVRNYATGWSNIGTCLFSLNRRNEAFAAFDRAVDANPGHANGWYCKGVCEANASLNERAMADLQLYLCIAQPNTPDDINMINTARMAIADIEKRGVKQNHPDAITYTFEGYNMAVKGAFEQSLAVFTKGTNLAPRLAKAWQFRAMSLLPLGRHDEAIQAYVKALAIEPRNAVFLYNKACIFGTLKRYDEAISTYSKATECDPSYLEAWSNMGRILGSLGRHEESIDCLERALALAPSAEAWFNKAMSEDEIGRKARAKVSYENFLALARPEHEMQINIARKRVAELGGAVTPGTVAGAPPQAQRSNPAEATAWAQKGIELYKTGRLEEALNCMARAVELNPDSVSHVYNKALMLDELGRSEEAIEGYSRALELDPAITGAWLNKGALLNQTGEEKKLEEAAACFDRAVELDPNQVLAWYNRGKNYADMGRDTDAVRCYDRAIDIDPKDANSHNNKGGCLLRLNKPEEALACFDKTISINPSHAFGWGNRGEALNKLRRFEEAVKAFDTALTIKTFASPWCGKGTSLRYLGRLREAVAEYDRAIDRYPEYSEAWYGKALCEDKLGLKVDAIASFKKYLSYASKKKEAKEIALARERLMELGLSLEDIEAACVPAPVVRTRPGAPKPKTGTGWFIGQKYEVFKELGKGGFGVVYHVYSHETHAIYALKTFRDEYMKDDRTREMFLKEAQTLIDMDSHPFLVEDYFVDEVGGRAYIAMEYVAPDEYGLNTLTSYLHRRPPNLAQSLHWGIQFCHGMEFVYSQGIRCHRDIKPDNIMIDQQKTVKIADFGLAGLIDSIQAITDTGDAVITGGGAGQTMRGASFGTPTHMPPEQFDDATSCDERSDIYSFGVVLFQMASGGSYPFLAQPPRDNSVKEANRFWDEMRSMQKNNMTPTLNSPLFPVIERCMAKRPDERFQGFAELRAELEPLLYRISGETVTVPERGEMNAAEWLNKGLSLKNLGRIQEAIEAYDKAVELKAKETTISVAYSNKGNCLQLFGKLEEALACYAEALRLDPKNEKAWCNRGYVLQQQGKSSEAIECYDKSLEIVPDFAIAWNNKAFTYLETGDYKKSVECAETAIKFSPDEDAAWVNKGAALYAQNLLKEALAAYDKALSLNPRQEIAAYNRGLCLHDLGRYNEAVAAFDRTIELNPKYTSAWNGRGNALMRIKNYAESLRSLEKAVELDPNYSTPWYYKGYVMIYLKKNKEAAQCFRRFIQMANSRQKVQIDDAKMRITKMGERL